jgi:hypothetical protein
MTELLDVPVTQLRLNWQLFTTEHDPEPPADENVSDAHVLLPMFASKSKIIPVYDVLVFTGCVPLLSISKKLGAIVTSVSTSEIQREPVVLSVNIILRNDCVLDGTRM